VILEEPSSTCNQLLENRRYPSIDKVLDVATRRLKFTRKWERDRPLISLTSCHRELCVADGVISQRLARWRHLIAKADMYYQRKLQASIFAEWIHWKDREKVGREVKANYDAYRKEIAFNKWTEATRKSARSREKKAALSRVFSSWKAICERKKVAKCARRLRLAERARDMRKTHGAAGFNWKESLAEVGSVETGRQYHNRRLVRSVFADWLSAFGQS